MSAHWKRKKVYGCDDKTLPTEDFPILIPYERYFGNRSPTWAGYGVAFLDVNKPSTVLGRAYLITEKQFEQVQEQEGPNKKWYDKVIELGFYGGYPVKTITNSVRKEVNPPSNEYLQVIKEGMSELKSIGPETPVLVQIIQGEFQLVRE